VIQQLRDFSIFEFSAAFWPPRQLDIHVPSCSLIASPNLKAKRGPIERMFFWAVSQPLAQGAEAAAEGFRAGADPTCRTAVSKPYRKEVLGLKLQQFRNQRKFESLTSVLRMANGCAKDVTKQGVPKQRDAKEKECKSQEMSKQRDVKAKGCQSKGMSKQRDVKAKGCPSKGMSKAKGC